MSDAKVVRISQNLDKVVRQAIELLGDTLLYAPPARRRGRFNISVDVRIEEMGKGKVVAGTYEHHYRSSKPLKK